MKLHAPKRIETVLVGLAVATFATQAMWSAWSKSLTIDEYTNVGSGIAYVCRNHYAFNVNQPPLAKLVSALAIRPLRPAVPDLPPDGITHGARYYGILFARANQGRIREIVFLGRLPHILLASAVGVGLWSLTRLLFGRPAGLIAVALWATDPNFLAHASVIHTDSDVTVYLFYTFLALVLCFRPRPSPGSALLVGCLMSLALATKFSAVAALALAGLGLTTWGLPDSAGTPSETGARARISPRRSRRLREVLPEVVAGFVLTAVVIAVVVYRGSPIAWFKGLDSVLGHNDSGHLAFLMGAWRREGWWYYFPAVLAMKSPLPLLGLALGGMALTIVTLARRLDWTRLMLVVWPLLWLGVAMTGSINIGIRHILPCYVFLFVFAGGAASVLAGRRGTRAVLAGLLIWHWASVPRLGPNYLAYFNELVGGPRNGMRYLVDSNLDWGQELIDLKKWMDRNGVGEILLNATWAPAPELYGINAITLADARPTPEAPAYLGIGATDQARYLFGEEARAHGMRAFLEDAQAVDTLGYSLVIYRVTQPLPPGYP